MEDLLDGTVEQMVGDVGLSLEGPGDLLDGVGLVDASNVGGSESAVGGNELGQKICQDEFEVEYGPKASWMRVQDKVTMEKVNSKCTTIKWGRDGSRRTPRGVQTCWAEAL